MPIARLPLILLTLFSAISALQSPARAEWIWVEGEKPVKQSMHRHPWYDSIKKDQFSGGDFISNFSDKLPGEATYELTAAKAGDFEFWVRTNPIQSSLSYRLNGGEWLKIATDKDPIDSLNVAADGKPDLRFIAWIKVGKVALLQGKNTIEFRMDSKLSNHGLLDCFVFDTEPFQPSGALKPDEVAQRNKDLATQSNGWLPFAPPEDAFGPAALDLRTLNEPVAGSHGFITAKGSQFIFPGTGQPVRFWAVNGAGVPAPERGAAIDRPALEKSARMLAKHGVNLVRLHGGMFDQFGNTDPQRIQQSIATVEALKAQGIYTHFSIYFPLWLTPKPDNPVLKGYDGKTHPFAALYFNPDFQKQYQSWWTALLTTPSEKTGKRLIDDAAVASAEIINEDSYFFWTFSDKNLPDAQLRILEGQFADWLKARYGSLDKASAAWNGLRVPRDAPDENRIGFRPLWNIANERTPRDQDTAAFLLHSQSTFYQDTAKFLRTLGFKGLITASNWTTADARTLGPLERLSYTAVAAGGGGSFIDRHGYFGCQNKGEFSEWSIRDGHTYIDRSALRFDPETPGKPKDFTNPVADPSYNNLPSMISETTFNRPNRFRSEAPLFYAAYGALQDSDCVVHFALDGAQWHVKPGFFMQPWTLMSPAMMGQFPAAALIFRQSLISPGSLMVDLNLRIDDLQHLKGSPLAPEASFDELRLKDVPQGSELTARSIIDPLVHFVGRTNINFVAADRPSTLKDLRPFIDRAHQKITSSNGQLILDYGQGLLSINAPAAQGLSGNLSAAASAVPLKDVAITSDLDLGHIIVVSLDDKPLATSARILVQAMTEEQASGFKTQDAGKGLKKILSIGRDPWMIREIRGTLQLKRPDAASLKVTALDLNGYPIKQIGTAAEIKLLPDTLYYLISK
jgi:hypothetical protein